MNYQAANYYELLNIGRDADSNDIKRAYFSAVKLHSPDSDPEGFKAIRAAYETLSDEKSRSEYDSYFIVSGGAAIASDLQNDLLTGRSLIRENKFFQAEAFLAALGNKYPDSAEVKRLHAEVLLDLKKSVTADKLCEELLEKDPSDCDTQLLRAKIALSRGHKEKAASFFNDAVRASPLNRGAWIEYMHYALQHNKNLIPGIFQSAMEKDPDMFQEDYSLYLVGPQELDLFSDSNYVHYYDKFAEFFINDKNHEEDLCEHVLLSIPEIMKNEKLFPFVEKILPTLENSRQLKDEPKESFRYIHTAIEYQKLSSDKRIHEVLVDLTAFLFSEEKDKSDQSTMECYIVFNLPDLRKSIKIMMNEYPECFRLNQAFYLDALNEKKNDWLIDKYSGIYKRLKPAYKADLGVNYYDFIDEEEKPFVRANPKVGRNDPCPCGSGKKYKKCCGRA